MTDTTLQVGRAARLQIAKAATSELLRTNGRQCLLVVEWHGILLALDVDSAVIDWRLIDVDEFREWHPTASAAEEAIEALIENHEEDIAEQFDIDLDDAAEARAEDDRTERQLEMRKLREERGW